MGQTKIEWCERTWSPVTGCTPISPGCANCYAKQMANRLRGRYGYDKDEPFKVRLHVDKLLEPLKWNRKPCKIFVSSMGDLFHNDVWQTAIQAIFGIMSFAHIHTYLVLTKRPERMKAETALMNLGVCQAEAVLKIGKGDSKKLRQLQKCLLQNRDINTWPLPNLWLGVSCENQEWADKRIPILLQIPAAVRFVSLEPLLEPIRLKPPLTCPRCGGCGNGKVCYLCDGRGKVRLLDWVIVGCESGPKRRPCKLEWVRDIIQQCKAASVPVFVKQLSINGKVSHDPAEWPEELRIRQWPKDAADVD